MEDVGKALLVVALGLGIIMLLLISRLGLHRTAGWRPGRKTSSRAPSRCSTS